MFERSIISANRRAWPGSEVAHKRGRNFEGAVEIGRGIECRGWRGVKIVEGCLPTSKVYTQNISQYCICWVHMPRLTIDDQAGPDAGVSK